MERDSGQKPFCPIRIEDRFEARSASLFFFIMSHVVPLVSPLYLIADATYGYTVKGLQRKKKAIFPSPAEMSLTKLSLGPEIIKFFPARGEFG
jgi:hypothetical protein